MALRIWLRELVLLYNYLKLLSSRGRNLKLVIYWELLVVTIALKITRLVIT